jgi:type IV pilus assembly protein PilE
MRSVTSKKSVNHFQRAFTLIELMITVAIVAIVAAIALPTYTSYITKSEIRSAQADLLALSLSLENRYQRTLSYPSFTDPQKANTAGIRQVITSWSPNPSLRNFNFKVEAISASAYTIIAEGNSGSRQANCKVSITNLNERTTNNCKYITNGQWL